MSLRSSGDFSMSCCHHQHDVPAHDELWLLYPHMRHAFDLNYAQFSLCMHGAGTIVYY